MDDLGTRLQRSLAAGFAIERELGGGGMARVFLAEEKALGRRVVVKVLDLEGVVAASAERFRREVQLIAKLQHPHIVPLLTAGGDDTMLWYVMPYVSGESLRAKLVREGAVPLAEAVRIGRELFDALGFAHEHGVVHRDVKPENILIEGRHALVADFGVAKALAASGLSTTLTSAGLALGTPAYMAPEQAMAEPTTNHRADLYAAGVVMYEMLVGAPPFTGNAQSVIAAHVSAEPPKPEDRRHDLPPDLVHLIRRLLAKNPAERPQSAHEALTVLETLPTPATTVALSARAPSSRGRRAGLLVVAAIFILALWTAVSRRSRSSVAEGADVIAVMPFGSTGDSALARLGRDLVVTLSTSLDGVGALRAVDPMSVLQGTNSLPKPLPLPDAITLARKLGASTVIHGVATTEAGQARLELSLYPVAGGGPLAKASTLGPPDSIRSLTDALTRQLLEQIWRRGKAPSSLLSEVATPSGPALRAFLSGEAAFERLAMDSAIAEYARAVALDSMFAQAWLRLDYSRALVLLPVDSVIRRHLRSMRDRLPPREQAWLDLRFSTLPYLQALDSAKAVAARYPESYAMQYSVMDRIVHTGPRYGIPLADGIPYLERLAILSPRNPDIPFHRYFVAVGMADTAAMIAAQKQRIELQGGSEVAADPVTQRALEAAATGRPVPYRDLARAFDEGMERTLRLNPDFVWYTATFGGPLSGRDVADSMDMAVARTRFGITNPQSLAYGRAARAFSRGSVSEGLSGLGKLAGQRAPQAVRTSSVWAAATAAWLGLASTAEADSIIARVKPQLADISGPVFRLEQQWAEGVIAIAAGDSVRFAAAAAAITDTTRNARSLVRELRALWRERRTGSIDSLRALEEDLIKTAITLQGLPIRRAALGRALVRAGDAAGAERLLQWPDAAENSIRLDQMGFLYARYTSYERGLAAEALGDKKAAIRHYHDFVTMIDRPPPAMATSIADAKMRLGRLTDAAR